jgi:hypothetical protein
LIGELGELLRISRFRMMILVTSSMAAMRCTTRSPSFGGVLPGSSLRP